MRVRACGEAGSGRLQNCPIDDSDHLGRQSSRQLNRHFNQFVFAVVHLHHSKNAKSARSNVSTNTERSRYLFPRSQDVSGRKVQAWQAAPCNVTPSRPGRRSAQSGSEAQSRIISRAGRGDCQADRAGPRHKAHQVFLHCRRSRVDQHTRHRLAVVGALAINPLPDRGRGVTAFNGKLPDHRMGERVQQDESDARIAGIRLRNSSGFPPSLVGIKELVVVGPCYPFPFLQGLFRKVEEDAFAPNFRSRNPSWGLP